VSALFQRLLKESYHQVVVEAAAQTQQRDEIGKHEMEIQGLKKIVARLEERLEALQAEKREQMKPPKVSNSTAVAPRSCEELRRSNETVESGMYWIDPDGHGTGDAPIYVSCNMTTGCQKRIANVLLSSLHFGFFYLENRIYFNPARQRRSHRCWPMLGCRMLQPTDPIQCHYETNDCPLGIII
jgi:hypothetical protein